MRPIISAAVLDATSLYASSDISQITAGDDDNGLVTHVVTPSVLLFLLSCSSLSFDDEVRNIVLLLLTSAAVCIVRALHIFYAFICVL